MMYFDFEAGNKAYKLRLNTRNIVALEKQLGCNPLSIFGDGTVLPTVSTMVTILFHSLQSFQHGIGVNEAYDIFDAYISDGHAVTDFVPVILDIYKSSGIISDKKDNTEKN